MDVYLVGGAVRDELLGLAVKERDFVVVGATPRQMLDRGYKQVGKDFPVFLHPDTGEEYALARTERKTAPGYHGFQVDSTPEVTLEDDLRRRDLTINAIARSADGRLIDPHGGRLDLRQRRLRHVSEAFTEDPVRVLRLARFAARYRRLGFRAAAATVALARAMAAAGEVDALVAERVWAETAKALREPDPRAFFETLRECAALARIMPEIERLFGVPQTLRYHPEVDTGEHLMLCLQLAARQQDSAAARAGSAEANEMKADTANGDLAVSFAVLVHDLGKGLTPIANWPRHSDHESAGVAPLRELCARLRVPKQYRDLGELTARYHTYCHRALELRPQTLLKTLLALDALRRPQRFEQFLTACEIDARGRHRLGERAYPQAAWMRAARAAAAAADARPLLEQGLRGAELAEQLRLARLQAIKSARDRWLAA